SRRNLRGVRRPVARHDVGDGEPHHDVRSAATVARRARRSSRVVRDDVGAADAAVCVGTGSPRTATRGTPLLRGARRSRRAARAHRHRRAGAGTPRRRAAPRSRRRVRGAGADGRRVPLRVGTASRVGGRYDRVALAARRRRVMPPATYVLPLRRWACEPMDELAAYLASLPRDVEVVVVDGSDDAVFAHHARAFGSRVRHERVDPRHACAYGKVAGVHTGVERASSECVVLARLRHADLVRPQNAFTTLPWHAWWDTGRTLLNRAVSVDHPGTLAVRRSSFLAVGGYDGDVLFENLELVRTIRAAGGTVVDALDVVVPRLPPTSRQFLAQRVRQAYDSLATPGRLAFELSLAPLAAFVATRRTRVPLLLGAAAGAVAVAERGRRRAGGRAAYPPVTPLAAPVWL